MVSPPCAACKYLRRKCTQECAFAPYFPQTHSQKFISIHRVFGASNVAKILNELPPINREDAVKSLYYEAEARLRDPIYGCVGYISFLQKYLKKRQQDLVVVKQELSRYIGPDAAITPSYIPPLGNNPPPSFMTAMEGMPPGVIPHGTPLIIREPNMFQHQAQPQDHEQMQQRMAAMVMDRGDHQQGMFHGYGIDNNGSVKATGFNHIDVNGHVSRGGPSLTLRSCGDTYQMGQETEHQINHGSVTATGFNHMDGNGHVFGGRPSLTLGSFGDAYQMGQETEHQINHGSVTATGFNHIDVNSHVYGGGPSLALGSFGDAYQMGQGVEHQINHGSVTATGLNHIDVNDHVSGGGPYSLASGRFGDAYQMGQEIEHQINHDQLQTQLMFQPPLQDFQEQSEGQFRMHSTGQENLHEERGGRRA